MPLEDADEQTIKAEIDEITKKIDSIIQKVESMDPARTDQSASAQD
jgi:hypothetical protein